MGYNFDNVQILRHQLLQLIPVGPELPIYNKSNIIIVSDTIKPKRVLIEHNVQIEKEISNTMTS